AHRTVAGGRAAALEALQARRHALADLLDLALGAVATGEVGGQRLENGVTRGERGTDRDEHATLGLRLNDLEGVQLGLGAGLSGLLGRSTASCGLAATRSSSLLSAGLPLCLGAGLSLGSHGGRSLLRTLLDLTSIEVYQRTHVRKPPRQPGYM